MALREIHHGPMRNAAGLLTAGLLLLASLTPALVRAEVLPVIFEAENIVVLSAERSGVLSKLLVDVGSQVKKGALLAQLESGELYLRRKHEQANLNYLQTKLNNLRGLNQKGLATDEELALASSEYERSRIDIRIYTHQIIHSQIVAPFDGVVVDRNARNHEWVKGGDAVLAMLDPQDLRVVANVPAAIAVRLKQGERHRIQVPVLRAEVEAQVVAVAAAVDEQSNTVSVFWQVTRGHDGLLAGMKGELRIDAR